MTKSVMVQWTAKKTVGIFLRVLRGVVVTRMVMLADVCMGYIRLPASGGDLIDIVPVRRYFLGVTLHFTLAANRCVKTTLCVPYC
jgi:hypothetical protein